MSTQRRHHARKKLLSGGVVKRPDAVWDLIVPSANLGKGKSDPITRAQLAHPYISLADQFRYPEPEESDNHADNGRLSEDKACALNPASQKGEIDEESSGGSDDTEGLNENGEHDEDDSEAAFDASGHTTQKPQPSQGTARGAIGRSQESLRKSRESSRRTTPEWKTAPSEPASASSNRPRKRNIMAVENSEEDCDEENEGEALSVPRDLNRSTEPHAQRQQKPTVTFRAVLSSKHQRWTRDEDEALFNLRNEGKSWEYIGERVLGRPVKGVIKRWNTLRTVSLKAAEMRTKESLLQQISPVVLAMSKIPRMHKPWTIEEEGTLISSRTQGMKPEDISKRIPGRGRYACKTRWNKNKDKYSKANTASKGPESDREEDPSDCEDAGSLTARSLEQYAKGANSKPRYANLENKDPNSNTNGDSSIDDGLDIPPAEHPYAEAVRVHGAFVSAVASKSPKLKATSIDHHNQKFADFVTGDEYSSPGANGSTSSDQPDLQSVIARTEPKPKKESSFQKDPLLGGCVSLRNKGRTQELEIHRRSNSWPQ